MSVVPKPKRVLRGSHALPIEIYSPEREAEFGAAEAELANFLDNKRHRAKRRVRTVSKRGREVPDRR